MAASLNGGPNGQGGRGRRGRSRPLAEMNVTPLVDVMLVLLIIFMVTAPLMTSGVPVDLPKATAQPLNSDSEPLTVSINAQGAIFLKDQQLELPELVTTLQALAQNDATRRVFVRGDKDLPYGRIMEVMSTITQGGFTKVALLAEAPSATPAGSTAPAPLAAPSVPHRL
jgi:biopolymer transport protein TolR